MAAVDQAVDLRTFMLSAGVSDKFVEKVLAICDEELIGNVENLRTAEKAGLLTSFFKPVVALSISNALNSVPTSPLDVTEAAAQVKEILADSVPPMVPLLTDPPAQQAEVPTSDFEVEPYWDQKQMPLNTFKTKTPTTGSIASVRRIVGLAAPGEVCHVQISTPDAFKYWEGQSLGVIPPGVSPKNGKPNAVRLYSIASTRYGDDLRGRSVSLCVRRAVYWCPELKAEDPSKKGVCSNFLCDAKPGQEITISGPTGKVMIMPEATPAADIIMVATGTGIAPYRGFLRRLFVEETPAASAYSGLAWLFLGVPTTDGLLYDEDWQELLRRNPDHFRLSYAISREQKNAAGGKMYIQDRIAEHGEELFDRLDKGAHIYFCGLKGMMPGIQETLADIAAARGIDWEGMLTKLKHAGQWHVEVY